MGTEAPVKREWYVPQPVPKVAPLPVRVAPEREPEPVKAT